MKQKKILFLGGAYAQIPIIKEARSREWYIITCDYLPKNPGHKLADEYYNVSTTDYQGILNLAKKTNPDYVVAYASDPAAPIAAYVSEKLGLPGNPYESIRVLSEKDLFRKFLKKNGFNTPKAVSIKQTDNAYEKISELALPIMVKPTDSSGSKGVRKIDSNEQIPKAIESSFNFSRNGRIIAEEFVECNGTQLHGDGFVIDGELFFSYLGDHHYNKKINPFVPFSTSWPSHHKKDLIHKVEGEIKRAIKLSGYLNGGVNIEARVTNDGEIYIMEIGPRSGGNFVPQVIKYSTGFNIIEATLDVLEGNPIELIKQTNTPAAYYVIHSGKEGILNALMIDKKLQPFIKEFHQYVSIGERVYSFQGANAAIGILLLQFTDASEMHHYNENMDRFVKIKIGTK